MDYKSVIEEQVRELQKTQDKMSGDPGYANESCNVAIAISTLCEKLTNKEIR